MSSEEPRPSIRKRPLSPSTYGEAAAPNISGGATPSSETNGPTSSTGMVAASVSSNKGEGQEDTKTSRDYYFDSYAHHAIHEEMLKDTVRTRTYQQAIRDNPQIFRDRVVMDVGCGTGILSMFCCQAGAKHVYAVDSSSIIVQAKQIIELNGFADRITCLHSKIEDIQDLPHGVQKVDVIVSEWMGYFLLYESMLDTVLYARDRWLKKDGIILPDKATMYVCGMEDGQVKRDRLDFWSDVYGFNMAPLREIAIKEPVVDVVDAKNILTNAVPILELDLTSCRKEDLVWRSEFSIVAQRNDYIHALCCYFECAFTMIHKPIGFSTAPFCAYTHWKQTLLYLPDSCGDRGCLTVCAGETISGRIECKPNPHNKRDLDIKLFVEMNGVHCKAASEMNFRLR